MTDYHVHIGQYQSVYYYAEIVFSALQKAGFDEVWFSSTTSCVYCKESEAAKKNVSIFENAPSARFLYDNIKEEIKKAILVANELKIKGHALYWVVPEIHFSNSANISINKAMSEIFYDGFKIHPRAQTWNLQDEKTFSLANEIFSYAEKYNKLILIHCNEDYSPHLFEPFIKSYPNATVQLAHSRPIDDTIYMLNMYPNCFCDTAMTNCESISKIKKLGFSNRIKFGSDFPITHWFSKKPKCDPTFEELEEQIPILKDKMNEFLAL